MYAATITGAPDPEKISTSYVERRWDSTLPGPRLDLTTPLRQCPRAFRRRQAS